jgi:hypothetical protein
MVLLVDQSGRPQVLQMRIDVHRMEMQVLGKLMSSYSLPFWSPVAQMRLEIRLPHLYGLQRLQSFDNG